MALWELRQTVKQQQEEIDELRRMVQALEKNTSPTSTPIAADIFITPQSLRKVKKDLWRHLN